VISAKRTSGQRRRSPRENVTSALPLSGNNGKEAVGSKAAGWRQICASGGANRGAALTSWASVSANSRHHESKSANTNPSRSSTSPVCTPMGRENTGASYTNV
jgi:hypothetical protein